MISIPDAVHREGVDGASSSVAKANERARPAHDKNRRADEAVRKGAIVADRRTRACRRRVLRLASRRPSASSTCRASTEPLRIRQRDAAKGK